MTIKILLQTSNKLLPPCMGEKTRSSHVQANHMPTNNNIMSAKFRNIMKTCGCNIYPLEPHFYIAKLGYAGVYLFLLQNIECGYSLEAVLTCTHNLCFEQKLEKYQHFSDEIFNFCG